MKSRMLKPEEVKMINRNLRSFNLQLSGGSVDIDTDTYRIGIDKMGTVLYHEYRVARVLMELLKIDKIVLDSRRFEMEDPLVANA